jgi:hypothetical protein
VDADFAKVSLRSTPATHATQPRPRVLTFVALGGEGKTSLVAKWVADLAHRDWPGCEPTIPGLTEPLVGPGRRRLGVRLAGLEAARLLTVHRDASGTLVSLDAHPLLREYFAVQLQVGREQALRSSGSRGDDAEEAGDQDVVDAGTAQCLFRPTAWRAAHRRLYEHLCATTQEGGQPTLEDHQPLYQAVAHGCQARLQQEACDKVYFTRILQGQAGYIAHKLGAFGSDLGAAACFFELPWSRISSSLTEVDQAWLLNKTMWHSTCAARIGPDSAQTDLNEAGEIAACGPMRLFMADIHLYRARFFGMRNGEFGARNEESEYPWESPVADLAAAEKLIKGCGYHRRDEELSDAQAAILQP